MPVTGNSELAATTLGAGSPLTLLHGITQNRRCWGRFADILAQHHRCVLLDLPGHGDSPSAPSDLWAAGDMVAATGGRATYVGYSLGGRVALHAALAHPDEVTALVLIGAHPGIVDDLARSDRAAHDDRVADDLSRAGLERFLEEWLAQPLFAGLDDAAAAVPARLHNDPYRVADAFRNLGTGRQDALWDRLGALHMPVLVLAGDHDTKYTRFGGRMAEAIGPSARFETIADAGHAAHLEQPATTADLINRWVGESVRH